MKVVSLLIFVCFFTNAKSQTTDNKVNNVLQEVSEKLNSFQNIGYDLKRELNYASENFQNITEWSCYFNFNPTYSAIGFQYQIQDSASIAFFNGTEKFELNKATKTIQINNEPKKTDFKSLSYLYNSIVTLRNILPVIIQDQNAIKSLTDTIINNHPYEVVTIKYWQKKNSKSR